MILSLPLVVPVTKQKGFYLNLNQYRNAHYHTLNKAKTAFKEHMTNAILRLPRFNVVELIYTLYPGSNRELDVANICSIVDKFFCDSLVELGKLSDDCYKFLTEVRYRFGAVDKMNPRVEVQIKETQPMKITFEKDEILSALQQYASKVMNFQTHAPEIILTATEDGSFIAQMDLTVPALVPPKTAVAYRGVEISGEATNTRAAVAKALEEAKATSVTETPTAPEKPAEPAKTASLLGIKPAPVKVAITPPKPVEEAPEPAVEPEQPAQITASPEDRQETVEEVVEAAAEPEAAVQTINGDVTEPEQPATTEPVKSIFSFANKS
jgi:hypothetical protein